MKIVHISDTHTYHRQVTLPEGDVLIHSGDISKTGGITALEDFSEWMSEQNFKHKIVIAGNHDFMFMNAFKKKSLKNLKKAGCTYLEDSSIIIDGVKFYGSPYQPEYCNWAFNLPRGEILANKWAQIPDDVNVLITHGPPYGVLDLVEDNISNMGRDLHQGCQDLLDRLMNLKEIKAHCFGHLHLNGGQKQIVADVIFSNAAICTESYSPTNPPVVFEI
jgi:Icc-related predicted phosphoesterase